MVGGGRWNKQNKLLPGTYGNFKSEIQKTTDTPKRMKEEVCAADESSILGIGVIGKMILS